MGSNNLFIPCLLLVVIIPNVFSVDDHTGDHYIDQDCEPASDTITRGSQYEANLHNLVNDLVANTSLNNGSMSSSKGDGPEQAHGHALCRPDVSSDGCNDCLTNVSTTINASCSSKEATIWHDYCLLTYSDQDYNSRVYPMFGQTNESDPNEYGGTLRHKILGLFYGLIGEVTSQSDTMFASGNVTDGTETVYAMVQCTRDQSGEGCSNCLALGTAKGIITLLPKKGGILYTGQCIARYDKFPFLLN